MGWNKLAVFQFADAGMLNESPVLMWGGLGFSLWFILPHPAFTAIS